MTRRSPEGTLEPASGLAKQCRSRRRSLLNPGNAGACGVGGDVFDMAEVNAVDAGEVRERVAAAEVEDDDALRFSVFLVIGKGGFHQELFADEPGGRVTAFADVARRTKILTGDSMGSIAIDADFNQLLSAVHLGFKIGLCAEPMWQATQSTCECAETCRRSTRDA